MSHALTRAVLTVMHEAANRAILPRYQSLESHQIDAKAADDVVTIADHEAEAILCEGLARLLGQNHNLASADLLESVVWELQARRQGGEFADDVSGLIFDYDPRRAAAPALA